MFSCPRKETNCNAKPLSEKLGKDSIELDIFPSE